jgi:phospholipase A1
VPPAPGEAGWQACAATADSAARLTCFDQWAKQQPALPATGTTAQRPAASALNQPAASPHAVQPLIPATRVISITSEKGCHDRQYFRPVALLGAGSRQ